MMPMYLQFLGRRALRESHPALQELRRDTTGVSREARECSLSFERYCTALMGTGMPFLGNLIGLESLFEGEKFCQASEANVTTTNFIHK